MAPPARLRVGVELVDRPDRGGREADPPHDVRQLAVDPVDDRGAAGARADEPEALRLGHEHEAVEVQRVLARLDSLQAHGPGVAGRFVRSLELVVGLDLTAERQLPALSGHAPDLLAQRDLGPQQLIASVWYSSLSAGNRTS